MTEDQDGVGDIVNPAEIDLDDDDTDQSSQFPPPSVPPPLPPGYVPSEPGESVEYDDDDDLAEPPKRVDPDAIPPDIGGFAWTDEAADAVLRDYWEAGIPVRRSGFDFYVELGHHVGLTAIETDQVSAVAVQSPSFRAKKRTAWELPAETWTVVDNNRRVRTLLFQHSGGVRERRDLGVLTTLGDDERVYVPPTPGRSWKGGPKLSGQLPDMAKHAVAARSPRECYPTTTS
jgi:hypothetical protein